MTGKMKVTTVSLTKKRKPAVAKKMREKKDNWGERSKRARVCCSGSESLGVSFFFAQWNCRQETTQAVSNHQFRHHNNP